MFTLALDDSNPTGLIKIQVHYRKGPLSQRSAHAEQYAQTKTNTNLDPNRHRRRSPDPNARIQKFIHYMAIAAICDSGGLPKTLRDRRDSENGQSACPVYL